jgi:DNA-binding response OmpR family regulator
MIEQEDNVVRRSDLPHIEPAMFAMYILRLRECLRDVGSKCRILTLYGEGYVLFGKEP